MRIATYNVNGINGRLPVLLRWLKASRPDVVCLQELKAQQGNLPAKALRDVGYEAIWLGQKSWNGVANLARDAAIHATRRGLPATPTQTRAVISRLRSTAFWWVASICPTGIPRPVTGLSTSSPGRKPSSLMPPG